MRTAAVMAVVAMVGWSCKKEPHIQLSPDDAAPPPDAADARYTGTHALIKAGTQLFRDADMAHAAFRTRTDHPTLFRLIAVDKKIATIATLESYDGGACFEPALGTVGMNVRFFVPREAVLPVTTESLSTEIADGALATIHPGAWASGGLIRSQHLAMKKTPATSFSFAPAPVPDDWSGKALYSSDLEPRLVPLATKVWLRPYTVRPGHQDKKSALWFPFSPSSSSSSQVATVRTGCVEVNWKTPKQEAIGTRAPRPEPTDAEIPAGAKAYYLDGSEAGAVTSALKIVKAPADSQPEGKLCGSFGGRSRPDQVRRLIGDDKSPDPSWILCFDSPE
jgi:hypothetical protein